jgi:flagellar protein FlbD
MIAVTRLDGTPMVVNVDQIVWIEGRPDTVISMMNGEKVIVRESPEALVALAKEFKRATATMAGRSEYAAFVPRDVSRAGDVS